MNANIHVFEDGKLRDSICVQVQADIQKHLKSNHAKKWHGQFIWHSKWNVSDKSGTRIISDALYNEAIDYCLGQEIFGIVCFDLVLQYQPTQQVLQVTDAHIAKVFGKSSHRGIKRTDFVEYPGLLLAFAIAKNAKANVEIYLGTSSGGATLNIVSELRTFASPAVVENLGQSIPIVAQKGELTDHLIPLVDRFIGARNGEEPLQELFWPAASIVWFKKGRSEEKVIGDVPHNFSDFKELYDSREKRSASPLGIYLRRIAGFGKAWDLVLADDEWFDSLQPSVKQSIESMVEEWLTNENTYRTMELFVGHYSMLGNGSERPSLSAFALPLLAALGPKASCTSIAGQLAAKFAWIDKEPAGGTRNFDSSDKVATKTIFIKSYLLFMELESSFGNACIDTGEAFDFLELELGIDSTIRSRRNGSPPPRHPLLTLTQFRADEQDSGTMSAYNAFQDACKPKDSAQDRALFSWFLPGLNAGKTVLKIGVAKRG